MPGRRGKPSGVGPSLRRTKKPSGASSSSAASRSRDGRHRGRFGARPHPEHDRPAGAHERQAPLRRNRRRCEGLRKRTAGPVELLLLGAPPDDARVRRRVLTQEGALALLRLQQDELRVRQRVRERDPRRAAARADVHDRARPPAARARARAASPREALAAPPRRRRSPSAPAWRRRLASQRSSGADDDVPVRLRALARRLDAVELLQPHVDDLPLDRRHRLELDRRALVPRALGAAHREFARASRAGAPGSPQRRSSPRPARLRVARRSR